MEGSIESSEDAKAVLRAQQDPRHFAALYEKYYEPIFLFIYKRVDTEQLASEICSNTFFKALQNIAKYKEMGFPFSSWLYRIAINEVNQYFREHKKAVRVVSLDRSQAAQIAEESTGEQELEEALSHMEAFLHKLDESALALIELRFFDQKSFKEMGEILGISAGNAKIKTYRALDKLKKLVKP